MHEQQDTSLLFHPSTTTPGFFVGKTYSNSHSLPPAFIRNFTHDPQDSLVQTSDEQALNQYY